MVPELVMPMPLSVFDIVIPPELVMVPELVMPVLVPVLDIVISPELVIVPELVIPVDIVTVTPLGIILSSACAGTTPPTQVAPVFQSPLAAAVMVVA